MLLSTCLHFDTFCVFDLQSLVSNSLWKQPGTADIQSMGRGKEDMDFKWKSLMMLIKHNFNQLLFGFVTAFVKYFLI